MNRNLAAVALATAMIPSLALAAAQHHPSTSARPHPAASAHAAGVAAEANARRIEACSEISASMLTALDKGDYAAAASNFDAQMKALLGPEKLRTAWTSTTAQVGKLASRGAAQTLMYEDRPVITTLLRFEKSDLVSQVACNADGKIAGFYMRPAGAPPGSAPASGG